jgi:hypothetical protein
MNFHTFFSKTVTVQRTDETLMTPSAIRAEVQRREAQLAALRGEHQALALRSIENDLEAVDLRATLADQIVEVTRELGDLRDSLPAACVRAREGHAARKAQFIATMRRRLLDARTELDAEVLKLQSRHMVPTLAEAVRLDAFGEHFNQIRGALVRLGIAKVPDHRYVLKEMEGFYLQRVDDWSGVMRRAQASRGGHELPPWRAELNGFLVEEEEMHV